MKLQIMTALFFLSGLTSSAGQFISEDTYCIKLKKPSDDIYFNEVNLDSIPIQSRSHYEKELRDRGKLLSRFNEEPLMDSNGEIFRSITFGAFNNPEDVQILRIEKKEKVVEFTIKIVRKLRDSTVLVHRKTFGLREWNDFEELADKLFINQPSYKRTKGAIHDGGTVVFEGHLVNKYHFIERQAISYTDPDMGQINKFFYNTIKSFFDPNCKRYTREN
jgi:hypothetical protein